MRPVNWLTWSAVSNISRVDCWLGWLLWLPVASRVDLVTNYAASECRTVTWTASLVLTAFIDMACMTFIDMTYISIYIRILTYICKSRAWGDSMSPESSCPRISRGPKDVKRVVRVFKLLWDLADASVALLPSFLSQFTAIRTFWHQISSLQDSVGSCDVKSYIILNYSSEYQTISSRHASAIIVSSIWLLTILTFNADLTFVDIYTLR